MSKNTYKIEGLDCPNCAKALESAICKINCVNSAKIDFLRGELQIESSNQTLAFKKAVKIAKQVEPDAKIITSANPSNKKSMLVAMLGLLFGGAISILLYFVKMPTALFWSLYCLAVLFMGYKTFHKAINLLFKGIVNENLLVSISVIGAAVVGQYYEGLMVIALYSIGKILEGLAVAKSKRQISELTKLSPSNVCLLENGSQKIVKPQDVKIGQLILVKAGETVYLDGIVIDGQTSANLQSLTGESAPVELSQGSSVMSGTIVTDGAITVKVTSAYTDSTLVKIMHLIQDASNNKSKTETFISKIAKWYTLAVMVLAVLVGGIVWAVTSSLRAGVYRGLIFLVISCPCAFAISVPLTYFSGIGNASKCGILIKGSNFLDAFSKVNIMAFDKTGTITTGEFQIEKIESFDKSLTPKDVLFIAGIGESYSNHPLAKSIVNACDKSVQQKATHFREISGQGVYFTYNKKEYFVGKKSKDLSATMVEVFCVNQKIGQITLADQIKHNAKDAIDRLHNSKIKTIMLSGDNANSVQYVKENVGIMVANHSLLPNEKYDYLKNLKSDKNTVAYVGDGLNDAPSLALADVGIGMGMSGSGASLESADVVIVDDNLEKLPKAIKIAKFTRKIVWQNILFSGITKVAFLLLGALGITGMLWAVLADVGVTVLAILNSLRALNKKI